MNKRYRYLVSYPFIRAWNVFLAGPATWNVQIAEAEKAPSDAIYRRYSSSWATFDQIQLESTRRTLVRIAEENKFIELEEGPSADNQ